MHNKEAEESNFVAMVMNNQSINDHINTVVRNTVTTSVNKRFIPNNLMASLHEVAPVVNGALVVLRCLLKMP